MTTVNKHRRENDVFFRYRNTLICEISLHRINISIVVLKVNIVTVTVYRRTTIEALNIMKISNSLNVIDTLGHE